MSKLIATIITVVVVLGLIGGSILKMKADTENLGSKTEMEQNRLNKLVDNPGAVTGIIVKQEFTVYAGKVSAYRSGENGAEITDVDDIKDKALFKRNVSYNADGEIDSIVYTQIDLDV